MCLLLRVLSISRVCSFLLKPSINYWGLKHTHGRGSWHWCSRLREILESTGLKQHVTAPTHISGHTLDLIITRLSDQLDICSPWTVYLFSDHMLVSSKLQVCKPALKRSDITFRKIRSINKKLLRDEISNTDLCKNLLSYNLDSLVNAHNNTFKSVLDHYAPAITKTVVKRPTVLWFNDGVKSA